MNKKGTYKEFDEFVSKNKVTQNATNLIDQNKSLTNIEQVQAKVLHFSITYQSLPNEDITATSIEGASKFLPENRRD